MYLIIKKYSYDTLSPTFTVVYSTEDYQDAMHKILAFKVLKKENERLRKNNETYKLKYIALIEKLGNLKNIINESITL